MRKVEVQVTGLVAGSDQTGKYALRMPSPSSVKEPHAHLSLGRAVQVEDQQTHYCIQQMELMLDRDSVPEVFAGFLTLSSQVRPDMHPKV